MPKYDYSKLLGKIREKGLTQGELAKLIGVSETTMNLALNNKRAFKQNEILRICATIGVNLANVEDYFFSQKTLDS